MSIYNIMAFNAAHDQVIKNAQDAQNIQAKKVQTQTAQEELDLNKKLDQAKIKQARNEGMMSDYIGNALEDKLNEQYKAKNDQLDAISGLQDIAQHKAQVGATQAAQVASQLHAQDPDVQAHVATLMGIMGTQGQGGSAPSTIADPNAPGGYEDPTKQMSMAAQVPNIPGIAPVQGGVSPQNVDNQVTPPIGQNTQGSANPLPPQAVQQPDSNSQPQSAPQVPVNQATAPQGGSEGGGIDLSPIEQAMGYPKGSLWVDPTTMKPAINPIWKSQIEKRQAAQANYDVNQPFREEQRQDRNIKTAETYLVNSLKQRGGAIGLQNSKVDAAIHARALINQAYDPATGEYNISQVPYGELSESMGALLSGQSGSSEGRIAALKQKTAQGDINGAISYLTGKPSNATSQDAIKQLVSIIDRQGEVSEELRDNAFDKMKQLPTFQRLDPDTLDSLKSQHMGNSFKEALKDAPDKQPKAQSNTNQKDYSHLWQ